MRYILLYVLSIVVALTMFQFSVESVRAQAVQPNAQPEGDEYAERIQPIFDGRCVSCHSCNNAPCQLNLQNYPGVARGATTHNVYDRFRKHSVFPSRVDIDAQTVGEWRAKGFFDVLGVKDRARNSSATDDVGRSLMMRLVQLRAQHQSSQPAKPVNESQVCVADPADERITDRVAQLGMPFGLPALGASEIAALSSWIERGAPGPLGKVGDKTDAVPPAFRVEARTWEGFLNGSEPRQKLVSRYLYEHLFLAHLYFSSATAPAARPEFFRLVRSRTACALGVDEIATRRPTDAPGTGEFFYCLKRNPGTIVSKTHIPYELTAGKLSRIKANFLGTDWQIAGLPAYGDEQAKNPFATFDAIPVRARYQFLLDDAQYQIASFIKGPVCNGSTAVNSIQEQFFVFFLKPDADSMVALGGYEQKAKDLLILPGSWGSDVPLLSGVPFLKRLVDHREQYRGLRASSVKTLRPKGYLLSDIWDGDGTNPNAVLTVLRHFDNAAVLQGAVGDLSKTVFVLDYALLERLVYNLVVNFDVFGNVGHQSLTRLYMDMIRMEAEDLFLSFLPPSQRKSLRRDWYRGSALTDIKLKYVFPLVNSSEPTAVVYRDETRAKTELVQKILFERMSPTVRGRTDRLNWKLLNFPERDADTGHLAEVEVALRRIASVKATTATPFARYFPDLATVLLRRRDGGAEIYSVVHNREHENISWIAGESLRLAPYEDTLTIRTGVLGAYPNIYFVLDESQVDLFSRRAVAVKSRTDYERLVDQFGMRRSNSAFWAVHDEIHAVFRRIEPVNSGVLDLTRYELEGR